MTDQTPVQPAPKVHGGLIAYLQVDGALKAADFYQRAFGAETAFSRPAGRKGAHHARASLHQRDVADAFATPIPNTAIRMKRRRATPCSLCSTPTRSIIWWQRAVDAGCEIATPLDVMFWGDRWGRLLDPFGISWAMNAPVKTA